MKSTSLNNFILIILTFYTPNTSSSPLNSTSTPQNDAVSLLSFKSTADLNNNLPYSINKTSNVCNWDRSTMREQPQGESTRSRKLKPLRYVRFKHIDSVGSIPVSISYIHRLRTLDLSYNKLTGEIPVQLSDLDRLNYLRLDSNRFNGSIPPFNQSSLEVFNVSVNFLTGSVPTTPTLLKFGPDLFSINPHLCGEVVRTKCSTQKAYFSGNTTKQQQSSSSSPESFAASKSSKHKRIALIIGVSASFLVFITTILCVTLLIKTSEERRRKEVVTAREMMELAEAADAAAEVMRMQEANELEKKVKKLHQGMEMRKEWESGVLRW
ncbi:putative non-specific serine/threonine protein kinase [Helianthus annuus]|nr:putative non-specific serine/threonine protein kinase [Helianthus annuus]